MASPLVSFVMPAWNPRPDWFRIAVASVLAQQCVDLELVVVDDGSPEPVGTLLEGIVADERLRLVRVTHGGVSSARNEGLKHARGNVIRLVDADDYFPPDSTAAMLALMGREHRRIAYAAVLLCDADLRPRWRLTTHQQGRVMVDCLLSRFEVRLPSMLFPREVVEAAGLFDPQMAVSEDWDWVLRAVEDCDVMGETFVACRYRRHGQSATVDLDAGVAGARRVVEKFFERHPNLRLPLERRAQAMLHAQSARIWATHGHYGRAVRPLTLAAVTDPRAVSGEFWRAWPAARALARSRLAARASWMLAA